MNRLVGIALALALLAPGLATAQTHSEGRARGLFEAGAAAIEEGDYENAYRYFSEAYDLSQHPTLLFNMANAAERLRRDEEALRLYRQYLEQVPDAENRIYVEGRIRALTPDEPTPTQGGATTGGGSTEGSTQLSPPTTGGGSQTEEPTDGGEATGGSSEPAPSDGGGGDVTGWILLGAGAAVLVAGVVMIGVGAGERGAVDGAAVGSSWADYEGRHGLANALMPTGGVLIGVGAALAAVGVVIAVTGGGDEDAQASLRVGPGGVSLEGTF